VRLTTTGRHSRQTAAPRDRVAGSVSKPIVSAAALALVDQGKLSLDDPVTKWLPDFRPKLVSGEAPTITVRQLLTHTSGLGYKFAEKPGTAYYQARVSDGFDELRVSMDENLRRLATAPLFNRPGEAWRYSLSIDVLGAVVEKASGKSLPQAVAELVTQPVGLRDTAFWAREPARLAVPYYDSKPAPARMADPQSVPFGEGGQMTYSPSRALDPRRTRPAAPEWSAPLQRSCAFSKRSAQVASPS